MNVRIAEMAVVGLLSATVALFVSMFLLHSSFGTTSSVEVSPLRRTAFPARDQAEALEGLRDLCIRVGRLEASPPLPSSSPPPLPNASTTTTTATTTTVSVDPSIPPATIDGGKHWRKCFHQGDWFEVCQYSTVCFDGEKVQVIDDTKTSGSTAHQAIAMFEWLHWDVKPIPPQFNKVLPLNTRFNAVWRSSASLRSSDVDVEWVDALYLIFPETQQNNIFFWGLSVFGPLWEIRQNNYTWNFPKIDTVLLWRNDDVWQWNREVLSAVVEPDTHILWKKDVSHLSANKLICGRRAVISGSKPRIFSGPADCFSFRSMMYDRFQIDPPKRPPKRLLFVHRSPGHPRAFTNVKEALALFEKYNLNVVKLELNNKIPFDEQLRLISSTGVMIIVHGAGLTQLIFLPPHAHVIEIFPYHMKKNTYYNLANVCGAYYSAVHSWIRPNRLDIKSEELLAKCEAASSIDTNNMGECVHPYKNAPVTIPIPELEIALINAFDSIGYRIQKGSPDTPSILSTFTVSTASVASNTSSPT